jgi:glycosyltransferase involved in cell wall biosynthesis
MLKIAVLAPQLIPTHPAGGQMLKIVQALSSEYEFTVFGQIIDESLKGKVRFYRMPIPIIRPRLLTYLPQFWLYGRLFRSLELDKHFDIVHSIEGAAPFASVVTMHYCGAEAFNLLRSGIRYPGIRRLYYPLHYSFLIKMERLAVRNPYLKCVVAVSNGLKREIIQYYRPSANIVVIPNSVDVDYFSDAYQYRKMIRQELSLKETDFVGVICALGDWERKGLNVLIDSVALLPKNTVKIIVVGGGPIQIYRKLCHEKGVSESFIFTGFTREVKKFYGASDFFILPTAYEAFPLVALEAAAAGLPLLVTRVNGLEDFVEEGVNGFFIQREPKSIAETIQSLVDNQQKLKEMGREAQFRAQKFRVENMVNAYKELYQSLYSNKRRG